MAEPLLRVEKLVRRFGGIIATDHVSLDVASGELHAIIGPNGAGKTTLISQLIGQLLPHSGTIRLAGRDITRVPVYRRSALGLARSFQITSLPPDFTAIDNVALAAQARDGHSSISGAMPARCRTCERPRRMHSSGSGSAIAPACWSRA